MKKLVGAAAFAAALVALAGPVRAQADLPVDEYPAARDVPGAHLVPDPDKTYRVAFDLVAAADEPGEVHPGLAGVARYVNTLAKYGVPVRNRKVAVVLHRGSTPLILEDAAYRSRHGGTDNPNADLIRDLAAAGVQFHVCGQAVTGSGIDPDDILPEVQLDLWALTTLIELERQGYVVIGG